MADLATINVNALPLATVADLSSSDYFIFTDNGVLKRLPRDELYAQVTVLAKGDKGDIGPTGATGPQGSAGPQGIQGIQGVTGATGPTGATGATGSQGQKGWSPVLAIISDGERRVFQVADWVGGAGTKPATGQYVGVSGLTAVIGDAIDVRGPQGATGPTGATGATGSAAKAISTVIHQTNNSLLFTLNDATTVTSDAPKRLLGWASYTDTTHSSGSPLVLADGVKTTLTNNAGTVIDAHIPYGVSALYNQATSKITPAAVGDGLHISIRFMATPAATNSYLSFGLDIGTGTEIFQKTVTLPRGGGVPNPVSIDIQGFSLTTFLANGGIPKLTASGGSINIYNIEFQIHRTSVG